VTDPRLTVELVPRSSWGNNLRSALTHAEWDKLRKAIYRRAGDKCEVCGSKGTRHPVECHEIWGYDDTAHVQTLQGLVALCPSCHEVKHFGRAEGFGHGERALRHLMTVNGWEEAETKAYLVRAFDLWARRSRYGWTVDLTWLEDHGVTPPKVKVREAL